MRRSSLFPWTRIESRLAGHRERHLFDDVRTYAMFIGQPRSGTSLLGSILNAHPDMCIAQELNALKYLRRGFGRTQLYWLLLKRDGAFEQSGRCWTGYDYVVPNQWQGRVRKLEVIGDKKAGLSTDQLRRCPELLDRLKHDVQVPVRMIHVVRDPYNVITTVHRRRRISLEKSAQIYFDRCQTNWELMRDHGEAVLTLKLESLIASPQSHLQQLCDFLNVESDPGYLTDCSNILFAKPRQSKQGSEWPADLVKAVRRQVEEYPFLDGYTYSSDETAPCPATRAA